MECPACHTPNAEGARFCAKCGALLPATAAPDTDPLIGAVIQGRFRITGILGEGGMGRVYKGEQQMGTSVRKVAIKTLLSQYTKDTQVVARFMRECGTVSELEHPNTIKFYDYGQTNGGELYIAMELLSGESLEKALETGALEPERVDHIVGQICGSLQEAHDKGIVHRDLKPANIYLTLRAGERDYVKVLDFGIAKRDGEQSKHEQKLTQAGTVLGTPPYMSPEQFKGHELDARSDIYSLGVMTYEMLTGRLPFDADTPWAWATQHMTAQPFPFETIQGLGSQVPPKMKAAVMRALSKDRERRQQTTREFYDELTIGAGRSTSGVMPMPRSDSTSALPSRGPSVAPSALGYSESSLPPHSPMYEPMVSSGGGPMSPPATYSTQANRSVPTGSGQVFAPAPAPARKGGGGGIIAIIAILVVSGCIAGALLFKRSWVNEVVSAGPTNSGAATGTPVVEPPPKPPVTAAPVVSSKEPTVVTAPTESGAPSSTHPDRPDDCKAAHVAARAGEIPKAVMHYKACENGAERPSIKSAIEAAALKEAHRGCSTEALRSARAAESIGITRPLEQLKAARCHPGMGKLN